MIGNGFISDVKFLSINFGILNAFKIRILPVVLSKLTGKSYFFYFNQALSNYLETFLQPIITDFSNKEKKFTNDLITDDLPIWVCWWQGENEMPEIIAKCYEYLQENCNGREVILITENNYKSFVSLPSYIIDKLQSGKISITHFSDILRVSLLAKYGGFWIDAAIWVTQPIVLPKSSLFTLRQNIKSESLVSQYRWVGGCIACGNNNFTFHFLSECLFFYWKQNENLIVYFILDYLIEISYNSYNTAKINFDEQPFTSPDLHIMKSIFNEPYDLTTVDALIKNNPYLSLTWRRSFNKFDGNVMTIYGYFCN